MKIQKISELSKQIDVTALSRKKPNKLLFVISAIVLILIIIIVVASIIRTKNKAEKVDHDVWLEFNDKCYVGFLKKNNIDINAAEYDTMSKEYHVDYNDGNYKCMLLFREPATDVIGFGITLNASLAKQQSKPLKVSFNDKAYYYEVQAYLLDDHKIGHYVGIDVVQPGSSVSERNIAFLIDGDGNYLYQNDDIPELSEGDMKIINELMPDIKAIVQITEDMLITW